MSHEEFKTWIAHHAALFWMNSPNDLALFVAWKPLVLPYEFVDFIDGSNYISREKAGCFRTDHLAVICNRIEVKRLAKYQAECRDSKSDERGVCDACRGSGSLVVPHEKYVQNGQWIPPFPTFAVFCFCRLGQLKFDTVYRDQERQKNGQKQPLAWQKYEQMVPEWRGLLKERETQKDAEFKARELAESIDRQEPLRLRVFYSNPEKGAVV